MKTRILGLASALLLVVVPSAYAGNWSMFHHDVGHGGGTAETIVNSASATTLTQAWAYAAGSAIYSSPAIVKNTATGKTVAFFGTNAGLVVAVNTATGTKLWSFKTGAHVDSSPPWWETMSSSVHGITRCMS